eukprot:4792076-Prymnesium_polylepis.1
MRWSLPGESLAARRRGGRAGARSPSGYIANIAAKCRLCIPCVRTTVGRSGGRWPMLSPKA